MPWAHFQSQLNSKSNRNSCLTSTGPNALLLLRIQTNYRIVSGSRHYIANLSLIKQRAQEQGSTILLAPLAQEWDVGIWNVPMPPPNDEHVLPWQPYREAQKNWAIQNKVGIVSFPDVFANYSGNHAGLFVDHMHPSPIGTSLMAKAVAQHINQYPELMGL